LPQQNGLFYPKQTANTEYYASKALTAFRKGGRLLSPEIAVRENLDAYWAINLDPSIRHSIEIMARNVIGKSWKVESASSEKPDRELSKLLKEKLEEIEFFERSRMTMAKEIVILGETYAFVNGERKWMNLCSHGFQNYWIPKEIVHIDRNSIRKINSEDGSGYHYEIYNHVERKWTELDDSQNQALIYINNSSEQGRFTYGNGLLDPLYVIYTFKQNIIADWLQLASRFGNGLVEVGIDEVNEGDEVRTLQDLNDDYAQIFQDATGRHIIIKRKQDEIKIHDPSGTGYQILKEAIDYWDNQHRMLLIGAILTVTSGASGGYNQAFVHQDTEFNHARYPRLLSDEGLTRHLLHMVWRLNKPQYDAIGLGEARPGRFITPEERNDNTEKNAARLKVAQELGLEIVKSEAYHLLELTEPTEEDEVLKPPLQNISSPIAPFEPVETQALVQMPKSGGQGLEGEVSELPQSNSELPADDSENFSETGSEIGVSRNEMPQFKGRDFSAFLSHLKASGVKTEELQIPASQLNPTQSELNDEKVDNLAQEIKEGSIKGKPIIISSDNYILDGHHRWAAHKQVNPRLKVASVKVDMPIDELLEKGNSFVPTNELDPQNFAKQKLAEFYDKPSRANQYNAMRALALAQKLAPVQSAQQFAQDALRRFNKTPNPATKFVALNALEYAEQMEALCKK